MHVRLVGREGLTAPELSDAASLLAELVAGGAALGWLDPPTPAQVATLLSDVWSAAPGDAALAVATDTTAPGPHSAPPAATGTTASGPHSAPAMATDTTAPGPAVATDTTASGPHSALAVATGTAGPGPQAAGTETRAGADRLVGLAYWRRYDRPTHWPHADVEKVAVSPARQGHGLGRRLMTALIAAARTARVEVLTLDLRADNERAAALYESLGFRRYGRLPGFVAVGDRRYDKLFYALDLRLLGVSSDG